MTHRRARRPGHWHQTAGSNQARLKAALMVTATVCAVEAVGGWLSGSLALVSDAGHMLVDAFALLLSLFALKFAALPATAEKSYGYYRLEILSALANGILLSLVAIYIFVEAWERLFAPRPVDGGIMLAVAVVGLLTNLVAVGFLRAGADNLNLRGAYLHVLSDTVSSLGVVAAGIVVLTTGETRVDPLLGAVIGAVILWSSARLVREAVDVLLEAIPRGIKVLDVNQAILETPGVVGIHHLHIWSLTTGVEALSAHVLVRREDLPSTDRILGDINRTLAERFRIDHTTIQVESDPASNLAQVCSPDACWDTEGETGTTAVR